MDKQLPAREIVRNEVPLEEWPTYIFTRVYAQRSATYDSEVAALKAAAKQQDAQLMAPISPSPAQLIDRSLELIVQLRRTIPVSLSHLMRRSLDVMSVNPPEWISPIDYDGWEKSDPLGGKSFGCVKEPCGNSLPSAERDRTNSNWCGSNALRELGVVTYPNVAECPPSITDGCTSKADWPQKNLKVYTRNGDEFLRGHFFMTVRIADPVTFRRPGMPPTEGFPGRAMGPTMDCTGGRTGWQKDGELTLPSGPNDPVTAQQAAALLTTINEIDMKPVMDLRNKNKNKFLEIHGVKHGFMSFFALSLFCFCYKA